MHADMETHSAAKLNMPHLRRDCGTGARSALNSRLCSMPASTSGALAARPDSAGMTSSNKRHQLWEAPSANIQAPEKSQSPSFKAKNAHVIIWMLKFGASLDVGAWNLVLFMRVASTGR